MSLKAYLGRFPLLSYSIGFLLFFIFFAYLIRWQEGESKGDIEDVKRLIENADNNNKLSYLKSISTGEDFTIDVFPFVTKYHIRPSVTNNDFFDDGFGTIRHSNTSLLSTDLYMSYQVDERIYLWDKQKDSWVDTTIANMPRGMVYQGLKNYKRIYLLDGNFNQYIPNAKPSRYSTVYGCNMTGDVKTFFYNNFSYLDSLSSLSIRGYRRQQPAYLENGAYFFDAGRILFSKFSTDSSADPDHGVVELGKNRQALQITHDDEDVYVLFSDSASKKLQLGYLDPETDDSLNVYNDLYIDPSRFDFKNSRIEVLVEGLVALYSIKDGVFNVMFIPGESEETTNTDVIVKSVKTSAKPNYNVSRTGITVTAMVTANNITFDVYDATNKGELMNLKVAKIKDTSGFGVEKYERNGSVFAQQVNSGVVMCEKREDGVWRVKRYFNNGYGDEKKDSSFINRFNFCDLSIPSKATDLSFIANISNGLAVAFCSRSKKGLENVKFIGKMNWRKKPFDVEKKLDVYFLIILIALLISIYVIGLIIVKAFSKSKGDLDLSKFPIRSFVEKFRDVDRVVDGLKMRSDAMLILGIIFGIGGVAASYVLFTLSGSDLPTLWSDPHTIINILKPVILLVFVETFTFFFLKQYRIIFNEYKLFYSLYLQMLNFLNAYDLSGGFKDEASRQKIVDKLVDERYKLYEEGTRAAINEFDYTSLLKIMESVNNMNIKSGKLPGS